MRVSIIIPVYNASKFIDECIQSAVDQTYDDIEIIAVDDGSKDDSLHKLKKYSNKIKIITKGNGGTASALNAGIRAMSGEWFKWLSADDVLGKNAIDVLINEGKKLGEESKSCIFYSNYDFINEESKIIGEYLEPNFNNLENFDRNIIMLDAAFGNGTTCLIHRSIFDRCGLFDETIGFDEDYEFWLRCCVLNDCKMYLIPKKLAKYRIHESQLTITRYSKMYHKAEFIKNYILSKLTEDKKNLYLNALKKYKKEKPKKVKIRRWMIDNMVKILPERIVDIIIQTYVRRRQKK